MSISRFIVILILFLAVSYSVYGQNYSLIKTYEDSVRVHFEEAKRSTDDSDKIQHAQHISRLFNTILRKPESFTYGFDSLKIIGKLVAPDQLFRIITWNVALTDGTYKYFGILQLRSGADNQIRLYNLSDKAGELENPENIVLGAGKWYGALYYKVLKNKVDNYTYYTMLGLRYHNLFTTAKLIEVLYFDQFNNPVFGAPIFLVDGKIKHRMLFQFSARVTMNLTYNEKLEMIVFDHLSPSESKHTGQYMYYGPDFSYDGFFFKGKKWQYKPNLDLKSAEPVQKKIPKKSNKLR